MVTFLGLKITHLLKSVFFRHPDFKRNLVEDKSLWKVMDSVLSGLNEALNDLKLDPKKSICQKNYDCLS